MVIAIFGFVGNIFDIFKEFGYLKGFLHIFENLKHILKGVEISGFGRREICFSLSFLI